MDKIILNDAQLQQLRKFINSRGFRDELVVNEILDHFACKVEEELAKDPRIDLQVAMQNAHRSFGTLGFSVIQANFEKNTRSRYSKLFWKSIKLLLTSKYLVGFAAAWFAVFKLYNWSILHHMNHIFGGNDVGFAIWLSMLGGLIFIAFRFSYKSNYYAMIARQIIWFNVPFWIPLLGTNSKNFDTHPVIASVYGASIFIIYALLIVAQYRLLMAATSEYAAYKKLAA